VNYPDSVRFLYALGNEIKTTKFGLDRIRAALAALGNPERAFRSIHVAGTNGKGSTAAMIESGLRAAGIRTGLYTSPHLVEPTERVRIEMQPVSAPQFASAFDRVHGVAEDLLASGVIDFHPTYFETVTAMAFVLFRELHVESAVIEVGLGGRLDATNVITPELCVITPIDFDHEQYLGNTIEAIAREKAGILKLGIPAVFARQHASAEAVLEDTAAGLHAPYRRAADARVSDLEMDARGSRFMLDRLPVVCPLAGEHQIENAVTAALALGEFGISPDGIANTVWPGRLEKVSDKPEIILDGAHNPAGARALAAYIERFYRGRRVWMIFGTMRDKAVDEVASILFPLASEIIATAPKFPRALHPETLRTVWSGGNLRTASTLENALSVAAAEANPQDAVFITGSLFLVGEARALLVK
jgi:dihydrofolate synthase / folylpolyglutamate synthase